MPLQVRLRHALGERLMDLPERNVERPLVVGRAREADVKIPSVSVAAEHCALFTHEGQWVLQDTSGGATSVNGQPVEGPTPLCIGDVVALGADANPATIEIDPAGAAQGRSGEPVVLALPAASSTRPAATTPQPARAAAAGYASASPARPYSAASNYASASQANASAPQSYGAVPPPIAPPGGYADSGNVDEAGAEDEQGGMLDWQQAAATTPAGMPTRSYRRKQNSSEAPLIIGIILGIVIVGGSVWFAYQRMHPAPPPAPPPVAALPDNSHQTNNIFTGDGSDRPLPSRGGASGSANHSKARTAVKPRRSNTGDSANTAQGGTTANAPSGDSSTADSTSAQPSSTDNPSPPADDPAWKEVEAAHYLPNQAEALLKFDDYRKQHAGDPHLKTLDQFTDDALDRLWWQRVTQLVSRQNDLVKQIKQKETDIKQEPTASFRKTLTDELKQAEQDLSRTKERLNDGMGYTSTQVPDLDDADAMKDLRAARDPAKYADWKKHTLRFVLTHHGLTEWEGE